MAGTLLAALFAAIACILLCKKLNHDRAAIEHLLNQSSLNEATPHRSIAPAAIPDVTSEASVLTAEAGCVSTRP